MAGRGTIHTDGRILFVPAVAEGAGTGHIKRCAALATLARGRACLLLAARYDQRGILLSAAESRYVIESLPADSRFKLIIIDNRESPLRLLLDFTTVAPVIGLDEGGRFRDRFPFLIDTLPGPRLRCAANRVFPFRSYKTAAWGKKFTYPFRRVLLSFGGEDRRGLTQVLLGALLKHGIFSASDISVVEGPLFEHTHWHRGVRVYAGVGDLTPLFKEHDLLITHFGLTCYEALACGMPFIVFNPTAYHNALTLEAGFPQIGVGKPRIRRLRRLLQNKELFRRLVTLPESSGRVTSRSLPEYLFSGSLTGPYACPLCNRRPVRSLARFADKSFFRCSRCGMIHALHFRTGGPEYDREYFFSHYRRRYGRTYLEDFDSIRKNGEGRLAVIMSLLGNSENMRLLDIGCAYGPFLKAAAMQGMRAQGADISAAAVRHVKNKLGMPCTRMDFQNPSPGFIRKYKHAFDAVSLWYVIEHFQKPQKALKNISLLLRPGGVLAFSTPSAAGISAKKNLRLFLQASPADHYTVWSPARVRKQLAAYGFTVKKIRITGHHAERFFRPKGSAGGVGKIRGMMFTLLSKLLRLGDTFEVYAVKIGDVV